MAQSHFIQLSKNPKAQKVTLGGSNSCVTVHLAAAKPLIIPAPVPQCIPVMNKYLYQRAT
jgi:hypothetical protein